MPGTAPVLGIWHWSSKTKRFYVDEEIARLYRLPLSCLTEGASIEDMLSNIHPEDKERVERLINSAILQGQDGIAHYRIIGADRKITVVHTKGHVNKNDDDSAESFAGASIEVIDENTSKVEQLQGLLRSALALAKSGKFWTLAYLLEVGLLDDALQSKSRIDAGHTRH
jgi:PAS domain-containing protein